jgi:GMP synthase-like glutamine amidotransferase
MLAFVNIEHENILDHPVRGPRSLKDYHQRVKNIGAAIGENCMPVHYLDFSLDWLRKNQIKAFFLSGNESEWADYEWAKFKPLQDAICSGDFPVMGFCGGHQFIGMTFGAPCDALGPLESGETDIMPSWAPGMRKEKAFMPMQVQAPDHPLFEGFPPSGPVLMESHYWEVKDVPEGLDLLASTPWCKVQIIQHREMPIFGSQGHAEAYTDEYPDGKRFIRNFAVLTGIVKS